MDAEAQGGSGGEGEALMPVAVTNAEYEAILALQCPYCAAKLPDLRDSDRLMFIHRIPGTENRFDCEANKLRGKFNIKPPIGYNVDAFPGLLTERA